MVVRSGAGMGIGIAVPVHFYDKAMLGLEGRDEQIENYNATIAPSAA